MSNVITARGLAKNYGATQALRPSSFDIPQGRIVGVIGANGAGKTTMLNAILGLLSYDGDLQVMGCEPYSDRAKLMSHVSYIADVATLPKWMKVSQLLDFVEGVHPAFDRAAAEKRLADTTKIRPDMRIKTLSKGMMVQLHLAVVLAIDARLLVLDEPTLGLDIIHRKEFYDAIITEYFDEERTILVSTHQVEEIEQILTHVLFIKDGDIIVYSSIEELQENILSIEVGDEHVADAEALGPISRRKVLGRTIYIFEGAPREKLEALGQPRRVSLSDIFIAKMQGGQA